VHHLVEGLPRRLDPPSQQRDPLFPIGGNPLPLAMAAPMVSRSVPAASRIAQASCFTVMSWVMKGSL